MLHEHARQLHLAGVAGGIVGRRLAGPAVLMPADQHEIVFLGDDAGAGSLAMVICTGRQPFSTWVRNHTRTGPFVDMSRSLRPAVRAMPMHGMVGISVLTFSGVGLPHTGFTEPNGTASFSGCPQFIMTAPMAPFMPAMRCFSCRAGE